MANEQKTTMFDKNDIADIIYNSFLRALETNNVKLNQRDKLIETLISEVNKLGKVSEKEEAKMREAVQSGFKKGASVTTELQKYFKDLERAINNKEYKRSKVTEAYPQASRTFEQREDRLKKSSVSRFNRLNEKYTKLVGAVNANVETLAATSNTLGETSRKLSKITLNLIDKSDSITNNVSWLENASQNITKSNEKATRLTRNLVGQSIKIDRESSWVESAVDNLRGSSRRLSGTFKKGYNTLNKLESDGAPEKKQEEDGFISRLVKKLENSKLGKGLLTDIIRIIGLGAAGWVYKKTGNKALAAVAGLGTPIALGAAGSLGYSLLKQKLLAGAAGSAVAGGAGLGLGASIATAGTVAALLAATKFSFDKGPNKYFKDMGDKDYAYSYEKMRRTGTLPANAMKPNAKFLDYANKKVDAEQETQKKIEKSVTGLFNMFKPAAQFIGTVFGGISKWVREKFGSGPGSIPSKVQEAASNLASGFQTGPLSAGKLSRADLLKKVAGNKAYDNLSKGGKGWSVSGAKSDWAGDVQFGKHGTKEILDSLGLSGLVMTSALGSANSGHAGKLLGTGHYSGTKFDFSKPGGMTKLEAETLANKLKATGKFATGPMQTWAEENVRGSGKYHVDATIKKEEYDKIQAREKKLEEDKKQVSAQKAVSTSVNHPAPSVVGTTAFDPTGNSSAMVAMMTINYQGMG